MAMHVCYKSLYISLPSSAKQQREMTRFCVVYGTWTATANISYFHLELHAALHILLEHIFRAIGVPKRSRQLRISLIKYKFIFYLASYGVVVVVA